MVNSADTPKVMSSDEVERIRLVELDLSQTNDFIKGVVATGAAIRGSAITLWLALAGFALQQHVAELGLLAAIVALLFLVADGYHGWLYSEASKHARAVERLLSNYYDVLSRGRDDPDALLDFRRDLRAHRFGLFVNFTERFALADVMESARPKLFYRLLYPALIVIGLVAWGLIGFDVVGKRESKPAHVIIDRLPK